MKTLFSSRINFDLLKYSFSRSKALLMIFTVLLATLLPIPVILGLFTQGVQSVQPSLLNYMVFFLPVSMVLFAVVPFLFFNYLFNPKAVDTFHSLPIKRCDLFITYSFTALLFALIPFTLNYFAGYGIAYATQLVTYSPAHFTMFVRIVIVLSSLTALTVFVIMNTGTFSDAIIYTGILSFLPFLAFTALNFFSAKYIFGFASGVTEFLVLTSPHFAMLEMIASLEGAYDANIIASYWLMLTIIATSISICMYNKRPSEKSGHPFTNPFFFPSIASIFTGILLVTLVAIWSTVSYTNQSASIFSLRVLTIPLLVSLVAYMLLSVIKNRSTKNSMRTLKQFGIIVLATLVICSGFVYSGGLGYEKSMPKLENVASVSLDNAYVISPLVTDQYELKFTDPKNIEKIYEFHERIINEYRNDPTKIRETVVYDGNNEYLDLTITYRMHKGSRLSRTYYINTSILNDIEDVLFSKEAISQLAVFNEKYALSDLNVYNSVLSEQYAFSGSITELRTRYLSDTASFTDKDWTRNGGTVKYFVDFTFNEYERGMIVIDSRMTQSLEYIEEHTTKSEELMDFSYFKYTTTENHPQQYFDPFHGYFIGINRFPRFDMSNVENEVYPEDMLVDIQDKIVAFGYNDNLNEVLQITGVDSKGNYIDLWLPIIEE